MSTPLTTKWPIYYRLSQTEKLAAALRNQQSINMIGMPAMGKTAFLEFFEHNQSELIKSSNKYRFVNIPGHELASPTDAEITNFMVQKLGIEGGTKAGETVVAVIDTPDFVIGELSQQKLISLEQLRHNPYDVIYLFVSYRPLDKYIQDLRARSRLMGVHLYLTPKTVQDHQLSMKLLAEDNDLDLDNQAILDIYEMSGGHSGLEKTIFGYYLAGNVEELKAERVPTDVEARLIEILNGFDEVEIEYLSNLANDPDNQGLYTCPEFLLNIGAVKQEEGRNKIFSSLMAKFLRTGGGKQV
jgi:hypothetical protein